MNLPENVILSFNSLMFSSETMETTVNISLTKEIKPGLKEIIKTLELTIAGQFISSNDPALVEAVLEAIQDLEIV